MTTAEADLRAVRRLVAGRGEPTQRQQDAERLAEFVDGDRRVVRALVQGLWDDNRAVRRVCKTTLRNRFRSMDSSGRQLLMDVLLVNLAGESDPPRQVVSLLSGLVGWIRKHRTEEPHLFSTVLTEAERSRRGGSYPPRVRSALKDLYREEPNDDSLTADVVSSFNRKRSLNQLLSETAPPQEVKSSLRLLGDTPLSETDFEVLLYHLVPLRNSRDQGVMVKATRNLESWAEELPSDDKFDLLDAVDDVKSYRRGARDQLPGRIRNELALSEVAVETMASEVERLRELPQYRQPIEHMLEAMADVAGVRDVVEVLVDVAREEQGDEQRKAIEVLCSILTGLDTDVRYNRDKIEYAYGDEVARVDEEIRDVLQDLVASSAADPDTVYDAVGELVRSRPDGLADRLTELLDSRSADDPVVRATLDAVSDEAILSATGPLTDALDHFVEGDVRGARRAIQSLESLGHDEARRNLLDLVEEAPEPIRSTARDALVRSGYYQGVRSKETKERAFRLGSKSEASAERRRSRESDRRGDRREYKRTESTLRRQLLEADRILREGLVEMLQRRIDSLDTLIEIHQENERVERMIDEAAAHHSELGRYFDRLPLGSDVQRGIDEEFASIEQGLSYLERLVDADERRASSLGDRITDVESELAAIDRGADASDDDKLRADLLQTEKRALEQLREDYRGAAGAGRGQISDLRNGLQRKRTELENASVAISGSFTDVESAITYAQSRQSRIDSLTAQRDREWDRIRDAVESRASNLADHLDDVSSTVAELEALQRSIDDTTRNISTDRLKQQHQSQRSREDQESYKRIQPRARGEAQHRHEVASATAEFYEHRRVYTDFIRRYYETQLDEIREGRFREQYQEPLNEIAGVIEEYYD